MTHLPDIEGYEKMRVAREQGAEDPSVSFHVSEVVSPRWQRYRKRMVCWRQMSAQR